MKVKVISLPYIFQVLYVLCFTRPRYQVSVYRTIGPLVLIEVKKSKMSSKIGVLENFSFLLLFPVWAHSILMLSDRDTKL